METTMVCSFCKIKKKSAAGGENHNVRTCRFLQAAVTLFIANKGVQAYHSEESMKTAMGQLVGDAMCPGLGTAMATIYEGYKAACAAIDMVAFAAMSKRDQAKEILKTGWSIDDECEWA